MLWQIIKKSNKDLVSLWEPLSTSLFFSLLLHRKGDIEPFQKLPVFDDYFSLGRKFLIELRKYHNLEIMPLKFEKWVKYFEIFNKSKKKFFLQLNRGHFFLYKISNKYKCPITHIIRNPLDSLISNQVIFYDSYKINEELTNPFYKKLFNGIKTIINILFKNNLKNFFDVLYLFKFYLFKFINGYYKSPFYFIETYETLCKNRVIEDLAQDNIDKFLLVWTACNYYAKRQVEEIGKEGMILYYEDIVNTPKKELSKLAKFANIKINWKYVNIHKKSVRKFPASFKRKILGKIKKLEIVDEVKYILGKDIYKRTFF